MASKYKWLYVPFAFALLYFAVSFAWWHIEVMVMDPSRLSSVAGDAALLVYPTTLRGIVVLIVTALALGVLPPITASQALLVAAGAASAQILAAFVTRVITGPEATNGTQVLVTAGVHALVLLFASVFVGLRNRLAA